MYIQSAVKKYTTKTVLQFLSNRLEFKANFFPEYLVNLYAQNSLSEYN